MQSLPDISTMALAVGVLAVLGLFAWFVLGMFIRSGKQIAAYLDGGSARKRAAIEHENKFGKPPLWLRAVRAMLVTAAIGLMAVAFWNKTRIQ